MKNHCFLLFKKFSAQFNYFNFFLQSMINDSKTKLHVLFHLDQINCESNFQWNLKYQKRFWFQFWRCIYLILVFCHISITYLISYRTAKLLIKLIITISNRWRADKKRRGGRGEHVKNATVLTMPWIILYPYMSQHGRGHGKKMSHIHWYIKHSKTHEGQFGVI